MIPVHVWLIWWSRVVSEKCQFGIKIDIFYEYKEACCLGTFFSFYINDSMDK